MQTSTSSLSRSIAAGSKLSSTSAYRRWRLEDIDRRWPATKTGRCGRDLVADRLCAGKVLMREAEDLEKDLVC